MITYNIEFITPQFSRGAYDDRPEVRASSIRGQLHWWFRLLGGNAAEEKAIFGGVHGGAVASKVVVRVSNVEAQGEWIPTLPHKPPGRTPQDGPNAPRAGFRSGSSFQLSILYRLGGLGQFQEKFNRTLEAWLLMGSLGLRTTRAAGSFQWSEGEESPFTCPASFEDYELRCRSLLKNAGIRFGLLDQTYSDSNTPLRLAADTIGGPRGANDWPGLDRLNWPLGNVGTRDQPSQFPRAPKRKTSLLRFRLVRIGNLYRLAALWDARENVTGNRLQDLKGLIALLAQRKPELGDQLGRSGLASI
ncbi:MAG: type III-B CRISPR module RAMP protein Cmr1 [Verrucomicrobiales bacterium]